MAELHVGRDHAGDGLGKRGVVRTWWYDRCDLEQLVRRAEVLECRSAGQRNLTKLEVQRRVSRRREMSGHEILNVSSRLSLQRVELAESRNACPQRVVE